MNKAGNVLTGADERALGLSERRILKSIFWAVQEKLKWRRRLNFELYKLRVHDDPNMTKYTYIKINGLQCAGHVIRMDNIPTTKRMFDIRPKGKKQNWKT
jgi:hypothetical protein